jgi:hypothetical protein
MRASGASHLVFAWPAFWWLEHYAELYVYVKARFRCLRQDRRVIIFDLMAAWPHDPR